MGHELELADQPLDPILEEELKGRNANEEAATGGGGSRSQTHRDTRSLFLIVLTQFPLDTNWYFKGSF